VVPIDFSYCSMESLDVAKELAKQYGSEVLLIHIVPVIPRLPDTVSIFNEGAYERELIQHAERHLEGLAEQLRQAGVRATSRVALANDVAMEIVREAQLADMLVIATHGLTGWRRLAFGSIAEKVVRTANCPVLVLRAKATGASSDGEAKSAAASQ
jgi:nucleotide-binding universal stress UspA family protein